jgi:hypothetical protein
MIVDSSKVLTVDCWQLTAMVILVLVVILCRNRKCPMEDVPVVRCSLNSRNSSVLFAFCRNRFDWSKSRGHSQSNVDDLQCCSTLRSTLPQHKTKASDNKETLFRSNSYRQ